MSQNKIIPTLWFHTANGTIATVLDYYKTIFAGDFEAGPIHPLGQTPSGNAELCEMKLYGQAYSLMTTEHEHHQFNDALSFTIQCDDQDEIDRFWNYFTSEGSEVQCGWCIDKHGLRWQVIPKNFGTLMSKPNAWEIMMKQKKIIIDAYL